MTRYDLYENAYNEGYNDAMTEAMFDNYFSEATRLAGQRKPTGGKKKGNQVHYRAQEKKVQDNPSQLKVNVPMGYKKERDELDPPMRRIGTPQGTRDEAFNTAVKYLKGKNLFVKGMSREKVMTLYKQEKAKEAAEPAKKSHKLRNAAIAGGVAAGAGAAALGAYKYFKGKKGQASTSEKSSGKGIVGTIVAFVKSMFKSIINLFKKTITKFKVKATLNTYNKVLKSNPKLASKKVTVTVEGENGTTKKKKVTVKEALNLAAKGVANYDKELQQVCNETINAMSKPSGSKERSEFGKSKKKIGLKTKIVMGTLLATGAVIAVDYKPVQKSDAADNDFINAYNDIVGSSIDELRACKAEYTENLKKTFDAANKAWDDIPIKSGLATKNTRAVRQKLYDDASERLNYVKSTEEMYDDIIDV